MIEDDYDSEYRFCDRPLEPLQSLDRSGRVLYVGSFSKTMLPILRIGFLVAPASLQPALRSAKQLTDWHSGFPTQAALARFIDEGLLARHVRKTTREYAARHELIVATLERDFADWLRPVPSAAGLKCMSLQRVDTDRTDEALALARAAREGARNSPARVIAMLSVRQALTHAARGDVGDCERLLADAERAIDRADGEETPAWATYFDQAEYCAQVAASYRLLGRHRATDRWLGQALTLQPDERSRDRATCLIWHAGSVLNLGEVERACSLVGQAAPDIKAARSARVLTRLTNLHSKLMQHRTEPAVEALGEQVRGLLAQTP